MRTLFIFIGLLTAMFSFGQNATDETWATTWGTSPEYTGQGDMPKTSLSGKSIRQIIRPSIGGDMIRLRLSNFHSDEPVDIKSVYLAPADDVHHAKYLTFNGNRAVTINARENVISDSTLFIVNPCRDIAITINYGEKVPYHATSHRGSRTTSYIADGCVNPADSFKTIEQVDHWYNILSLEVERNVPVVAVLGNSITDGRGSTTNAQNRWTDQMALQLEQIDFAKGGTAGSCGVVNLGIGGNCVLEGGISEPLIKRYKDELGFHSGISHIIIYEGTNDIGTSSLPPDSLAKRLINAYKEIITYAHAKHMFVYMATITPTKGNGWYSVEHEKARQLVNKWIRSGAGFEGIIDFDELVRDPSDPEKLRAEYSDDWLHLNPKGYEAMGNYASSIINK